MPEHREKLIRETFELDRDIAFRQFRRLNIERPEIVQACPDPAVREEMLRGFWNQDAEKHYPEFQRNVAGMSMDDLTGLRDRIAGELRGEYQQMLNDAASRLPDTPAEPDQGRGR